MGLKRLAACFMISGLSLLAACGGGGGSSDSGKAQIRLVNASSAYASLDLKVGDNTVASGVAYGAASGYAAADAGSSQTALVLNNSSTVTSLYPTLTKDSHYSLISYGWAGNMKSTILAEEEAAPADNYSKLLVLNLAPDAGKLDVYLTQNIDDLANATPTISGIDGGSSSTYNTLASGSYRLRITGNGKNTDLRLDIPAVSLTSKQVATLVLTPTQGGVLVNSILLVQQGTPTAYGATQARARVVAALPDAATVSATLGGKALLASSQAPQIADYQIVGAGNPALNVTVNGVAQAVSTPALGAGNDYTVLVWGEPGSPQITVLPDDNRLPASGTAKFRLINGVARLNAGLTMTLDYSAIASNVMPGNVSSTSTVNASTSSLLTVNAPGLGTVYSVSALPVVGTGIYTAIIMGSAIKMESTLRRER